MSSTRLFSPSKLPVTAFDLPLCPSKPCAPSSHFATGRPIPHHLPLVPSSPSNTEQRLYQLHHKATACSGCCRDFDCLTNPNGYDHIAHRRITRRDGSNSSRTDLVAHEPPRL